MGLFEQSKAATQRDLTSCSLVRGMDRPATTLGRIRSVELVCRGATWRRDWDRDAV